tara:strand:+ start:647 stop:823 length:177 start_codon:yes stop_codon:yes gene_type:complete
VSGLYPLAYTLQVEGVVSREITIVSDSLVNAERIAKEEFINELKGDNAYVILKEVNAP